MMGRKISALWGTRRRPSITRKRKWVRSCLLAFSPLVLSAVNFNARANAPNVQRSWDEPTQLEVIPAGLAVGSLRKDFKSVMSRSNEVWHWTLYVSTHPGSPLPGFRHHGSGDSRETAQADLEKMWGFVGYSGGLG